MHPHPRWRHFQRQMRGDGFPLPVLALLVALAVLIGSALLERCGF